MKLETLYETLDTFVYDSTRNRIESSCKHTNCHACHARHERTYIELNPIYPSVSAAIADAQQI
jgi:hypothetical protein